MFPQLRSDFVHIDGSDNMLISHGDKHSSDTEVSFEKRLQESRKEQNEVNMVVSDKDLSPNKPPKQKLPGYYKIMKKDVINYKDMKVSYSDTTDRENYDINVKGSEDTDSENEIQDSLLIRMDKCIEKYGEDIKNNDKIMEDIITNISLGELSEIHEVDAIKILQNIEKALNIKTAPLVVGEETYLNKIDELLKTILESLDGQQSNSETVKIRDILKSDVLQIKASIASGELSEKHEVDAIKILQNIEKALNIKTAPLIVSEEPYLNKIDELLKTILKSLDGQQSNSETAKIRDILKSDVLQIKTSIASGELSEIHEVDAIKILQNIEKALNIKTDPLVVSEETYLNKTDELLKTILKSLDGQQSNSETAKIRDILKTDVLQIKTSIGSGKDMDIDLDNKLTKTLDQKMKQDIMKQDVRIDTAKNSGKPKDMGSSEMGIKNTDKMIAEKLTIMPEDIAQSDKVDKVNDSFVKEPGNNLKPYIMFNGNGEVSDIKSQVDIKKVDLRDIAGIKELVEHINIIKTSNGHKAVLDLSPENLGKLQVHITHENGKLVAKFIVENEQAKQLLISNSEIIKQNLQQKGIDVSNMSFINLNENGYKEQSESREDVNKVELKGNHNKVSNNVEDNKLLKNGEALYA